MIVTNLLSRLLTIRNGIGLTVLLCLQGLSGFAGAGSEKTAAIDALVKRYVQQQKFNGAVLVAYKGKVIYRAGHGEANLNWDIGNTHETIFSVGSITKQFTAMMVMQLVQEGKLKLNDGIGNHLPALTVDWGSQVEIRHLLNHTGGVPNTIEIPGWFDGRYAHIKATDDFVRVINGLELNFQPGSDARYSNCGFFLLGALVESVTGMPYEAALNVRILKPLGMTNSGNGDQNRIVSGMASDYILSSDGGLEIPNPPNMHLLKGSGSMYTTVEDLYKWDRALYTQHLLDEKHKKIMFTPNSRGTAFGWNVADVPIQGSQIKHKAVFHGGQVNGFNALITRFVDDQHLIVLLHNKGETDLSALTLEIAATLYGTHKSKQ